MYQHLETSLGVLEENVNLKGPLEEWRNVCRGGEWRLAMARRMNKVGGPRV